MSEDLLTAAFNGSLSLDELLTDYFVRDLHERLYGDIWSWAGGGDSETSTLGLTQDRSPSNSAAHSTTSDIGGSTRTTGQPASLASRRTPKLYGYTRSPTEMAAPQGFLPISCSSPPRTLLSSSTTGTSIRGRYSELLRSFDTHRNARELTAFVGVQPIEF